MENSEKISAVLKSVFNNLTKDSLKFFDLYSYKTTEIMVNGVEIGIGLSADFSIIKLYTIKPEYKKDDYRKFNQTFIIGKAISTFIPCWVVGLSQSYFSSDVDDFSVIAQHFYVANDIIKMIEENAKD